MANMRNANTFFIDTASSTAGGTLILKNVSIVYLVVNATADNSHIELFDVTTGADKIHIHVPIQDDSRYFDFSEAPILFPNGIDPQTVTNCVATCVIRESNN